MCYNIDITYKNIYPHSNGQFFKLPLVMLGKSFCSLKKKKKKAFTIWQLKEKKNLNFGVLILQKESKEKNYDF